MTEPAADGRTVRVRLRRGAAPLSVAVARLRARPGRVMLLATGVAGATAMLVAVLGGGIVARDRAVQSALAALPAGDRTFRVDAFGLPEGESYAGADLRVRRVLGTVTPGTPLAGTFFRQLRIAGGLVQLASIDRLDALVRLRSGRLPRSCVPARCEVLQVGPGARSSWRQDGINLVRVGVGRLPDGAVFGPWLEPGTDTEGPPPTRLVTSGANAFSRVPAFDDYYRVHSWIAPVAPRRVHVWEITGVLARESRAQTALAAAGAEYALNGPDGALLAARTTGAAAGRRLNLIGGEISVLLLGFALVAALGMRRGLAAERRRLAQRGATTAQQGLAVVAEICAITVAGAVVGMLAGAAIVAGIAGRAGLPWGAVIRHGPGSRTGGALVLGLLLVAVIALVAVSVRGPEAGGGRRLRIVDVIAIAAAGAAALGLARGHLDAETVPSGGDATFLLLLPGLVCFAAGVAAARLLGPVMRGAERLTRRSSPALRLAMLGLARAPVRTSATAAFLVVAVGLALFATAYRTTLQRGAADDAAFAVPLDFSVTQGPRLVAPLEAAPVAGYDRIAPGVRAYPVVRQTAEVPGAGTSVLSPTVLGVAPGALGRLHWRGDYSGASLSTLATGIGADPPASLRGLPLPPGSAITLDARVAGSPVQLELAAQDDPGDVVLLPLAPQGPGSFRARTPAGRRLKLVGLEISVVTDEATGLAHRAAEGVEPAIPGGSIELGPLRTASGPLTDWRGWVSRGGSLGERDGRVRVRYAFATGQAVLVRRPQATDGRPLLVIASPSVASAAGPGGALVLDFGVGRVPARIVGVASRFPGTGPQGDGFVVADESRLSVALDGSLPGTGRTSEVWLAAPLSASPQVDRALARPPFSPLVVASRRRLERALADDPLARGATLTLAAAAVVALVLAVLALWLALAGEVADERGELLDLEAQGVAPETLRRQVRVRAAVLTGTALVVGGAVGILLSRLVIALVRLSGDGATPEPPLRLDAGWPVAVVGLAAIVLASAVVVELTTRRAFRGESAGRPSWSLE